jgi:hypothetical protein
LNLFGKAETQSTKYLLEISKILEKFEIEKFKFHSERDYVLDCNWKVFIDNYLDGGKTIYKG